MDNIQKMFQAIINGQSAFRQEVLNRIDSVESRLEGKIGGLDIKIDQVAKNLSDRMDEKIDDLEKKLSDRMDLKIDRLEKKLTDRLDKIGTQLAYLEDDAPTWEEFDYLEERVDKIELKPASHL